MQLIVEIAGKPVPQARQRVTANGTFYPKASTAYRNALKQALWLAARQQGWTQDFKGKVELRMVVSLVLPAKRGDASNYQKQVEDAIADAGLIANDNQIVAPAALVLNGQASEYLWVHLLPISETTLNDRATQWMLEVA